MRTSEEIDQLAKALAEAQGEFPKIAKSKTADVPMKNGGQYSYNYADLADVLEVVRPVLSKHKLAVAQAPDLDDDSGKLRLLSRLMHESGQWIESHYPLPAGGSPQDLGGAVTYARRYSLCALLGIAAEDDDDGARASQAVGGQAKARPANTDNRPANNRQSSPPANRQAAPVNKPAPAPAAAPAPAPVAPVVAEGPPPGPAPAGHAGYWEDLRKAHGVSGNKVLVTAKRELGVMDLDLLNPHSDPGARLIELVTGGGA